MIRLTVLRRLGVRRIALGLVVIIVILQVYHFKLLSDGGRREHGEEVLNSPDGGQSAGDLRSSSSKAIRQIITDIINKLQNVHMLDRSGTYGVAPDLYAPHYLNKLEDVAIVTQTTSDHLEDLIFLSKRWTGPISVSVFTHGVDAYNAIAAIAYLCVCYERIRTNTQFHIAFPLSHSPRNTDVKDVDINCDIKLKDFLPNKSHNYDIDGLEYPHNMLRNLAIHYSKTSYIFMIDIDMVPSANLHQDLVDFLHERSHMPSNQAQIPTAFVVPVFECSGDYYPENREKLLELWSYGIIRPFYIELCKKCQKYTDYMHWKDLGVEEDLGMGYEVEWRDPWEPFYIIKKDAPLYDERFKQYGFNRISQACELHVADYRFAVLNNAFIMHRGFKQPGGFHPGKEEEQERNRLLFRRFKEELKTKYPNSQRRCY